MAKPAPKRQPTSTPRAARHPSRREPRFLMRVWDLPTRLFLWLAGATVIGIGLSLRLQRPALRMGLEEALLALVLFRIGWGVVGSHTARFGTMLHGPGAVLRQLARIRLREPDDSVGHSPAGGWLALLMILALLAHAATGLLARFGDRMGPLAHLLPPERIPGLTIWHLLSLELIAVLAVWQIAGLLLLRILKGQDRLRPMITGRKRLPGHLNQPRMQPTALALAVFCAAAALVWVLVTRL